jgi:hypothetical protein
MLLDLLLYASTGDWRNTCFAYQYLSSSHVGLYDILYHSTRIGGLLVVNAAHILVISEYLALRHSSTSSVKSPWLYSYWNITFPLLSLPLLSAQSKVIFCFNQTPPFPSSWRGKNTQKTANWLWGFPGTLFLCCELKMVVGFQKGSGCHSSVVGLARPQIEMTRWFPLTAAGASRN